MSINRSPNLRYLATVGAAALALIGCDPDSKPDEKVAEVDRVRAQMLQTCIKKGSSKYHPLYKLAYNALEGHPVPRFDSVHFFHDPDNDPNYVNTRLSTCHILVRRRFRLECSDDDANGDWESRKIFREGIDGTWKFGETLKPVAPEIDPALWVETGKECDEVYRSVLLKSMPQKK